MEEQKTIERLDLIREHYNLSSSELESKIGYSNGGFGKALKSRASVKDDIIKKTVEVFPKVNLRWLVLGEGSMEGMDMDDPEQLINHFVLNHEKFMGSSLLYREKISNLVKDEFIKRYGGLLKDKE